MPRSLADIFNENPDVEIIEIIGYNDGEPYGLSPDGLILKIMDVDFARQLANLPEANTEAGYITDEGYCIHGSYVILKDSYKASVQRKMSVTPKDDR